MNASPVEPPPAPETEQTASSVLASGEGVESQKVKLASAQEITLLSKMLPVKDAANHKRDVTSTSRRAPDADPAPAPNAETETEKPAFTPVETTAPSVNDGWRPRVAAP